jgi:hypothetical protein
MYKKCHIFPVRPHGIIPEKSWVLVKMKKKNCLYYLSLINDVQKKKIEFGAILCVGLERIRI